MAQGPAAATASSARGGEPSAPRGGRCGGAGAGCGLGRLVRKLRRQSKMLRGAAAVARPASATFRCQYDPLSYARNFDRDGFGTGLEDDSGHFYNYTFSSRFVLAASAALTTPIAATSH